MYFGDGQQSYSTPPPQTVLSSGAAPPPHCISGSHSAPSGGGFQFTTLTPRMKANYTPAHFHGPGLAGGRFGGVGGTPPPPAATAVGTPLASTHYVSGIPGGAVTSAASASSVASSMPQTYHGGISLQLLNLDFSDAHMTNALLHSADVRVTVDGTHLTCFCTTRRVDVLRVPFLQVLNVDRKLPSDHRGAGAYPALQLDYSAQSGEAQFLPGAASTRQLRCVLYNASREFVGTMFQAILTRWSFARVASDSYDYGNAPLTVTNPSASASAALIAKRALASRTAAPHLTGYHHPLLPWQAEIAMAPRRSPPHGEGTRRESHHHRHQHHRRRSNSRGGGERTPRSLRHAPGRDSRRCWSSSSDHDDGNNNYDNYDDDDYHSGGDVGGGGTGGGGDVHSWAEGALSAREHHAEMRELEAELHMIQQRRRQRQPWLVSSDEAHGALFALDALASRKFGQQDKRGDTSGGAPYVAGGGSAEWPTVSELRALAALRSGRGRSDGRGNLDHAKRGSRAAAEHRQQAEADAADAADAAAVAAQAAQAAARESRSAVEGSGPVREFGNDNVLYEGADRRCVWCNKWAPKSHDAKCIERRVLCAVCHQEVYLRDKQAHRAKCVSRDNPKKKERLAHEAELRALKEQVAQQEQEEEEEGQGRGKGDRDRGRGRVDGARSRRDSGAAGSSRVRFA